tara:strand:- start:8436 stop:9698 length:1263 start_codon:yes stop_codon:yes gene_type:complete
MAITDHGNVGNFIKFIELAEATKDKKGNPINYDPIVPILGCEFYLSANHNDKSNKEQLDGRRGNRHLNLYAMSFKGYQNLCTLSQLSFTDGFFYDPRIDIEQMAEHSEGIMVGSACLSSVLNANLLADRYDKAKKVCHLFKDLFKENFFLEVMYHGIPEQAAIIPDIFRLSREMDIPICATNDSHYIKKEQAKSQEVLMAMNISKCLKDPKRIRFPYGEFYLKSADEMAKIWGHVPQTMSNSLAMLERFDIEDIKKNLFGGMRLPRFDVPKGFKNPFEYLKHLTMEGMKRKGWDKSPDHVKQIERELSDVQAAYDNNGYDFSTYFLIVKDYIDYAREKNIMVGYGRGSGFGSTLLHCLGICTGVDPLKHGLLFERFLGFEKLKFVKPNDFGFTGQVSQALSGDAEEEVAVEDDGSGISRY